MNDMNNSQWFLNAPGHPLSQVSDHDSTLVRESFERVLAMVASHARVSDTSEWQLVVYLSAKTKPLNC